jgi:two-component system NtrC family sensor kinase
MKIDRLHTRQKNPRPWSLVLIVMLVAGVPLLVIGLVIVHQFGEVYRNKVTDHLSVLVRKHSRTIDSFLTDRLGDIRVLARSHDIDKLMNPIFLTNKLAILREEYGGVFVDIGLIGPDGIQHAYSGPFNLAKANYADAVWFSEAQKSQYYVSDVFSGLRGSPHFIVAVRIPQGSQGWILRATVDFQTFNALVSNIRIDKTGFAFIINRAGAMQTNTHFDANVVGKPHQRFLKADLEHDKVRIETIEVVDGQESIFAITPLNNGRWILIFQQELADAFATWNRALVNAALLFLLWTGVVAMFTYFISRNMTLLIEEEREQKEKMSDQVVEAGRLASIGELAAGIAHEINNPVAIMVEEAGWIKDLLEEPAPMPPDTLAEIDRAASQIKTQGGRCKEITHKLLSFARKTDPTIKEIDLNALVAEMITLVDQKTRYANVQIDTQLAADLPPIWASATEIQQVLLNLLNNSVDAMGASGGTIKIATGQQDGWIVLTVADDGAGIAEANLARIFDPFYTTKPVGQGTGLGLSICYGIINKLGGDIRVQSAKGQGTAFRITLPIDKEKTGAHDGDRRITA